MEGNGSWRGLLGAGEGERRGFCMVVKVLLGMVVIK